MDFNRLIAVVTLGLVISLGGYLIVTRTLDTPIQHHEPRVSATNSPKPRTRVARERAQEYWHANACNGEVKFTIGPLSDGQYGYASWTEQRDGRFTDCEVIFSRRVFGHGKHAPFSTFCGVMVHEVGHLIGKVHTNDPKDVMYPIASNKNIPAVCRRDQQGAEYGPVVPGRW